MKEKQPTEGQIKEFWEWCGFKFYQPVKGGAIDVIDPEGNVYLSPSKMAVPELDPNNFFKYAVPVAIKALQERSKVIAPPLEISEYTAFREIIELWLSKNPIQFGFEITLFWAIWEVIKNEALEE